LLAKVLLHQPRHLLRDSTHSTNIYGEGRQILANGK
jgi:hypothetical protein